MARRLRYHRDASFNMTWTVYPCYFYNLLIHQTVRMNKNIYNYVVKAMELRAS